MSVPIIKLKNSGDVFMHLHHHNLFGHKKICFSEVSPLLRPPPRYDQKSPTQTRSCFWLHPGGLLKRLGDWYDLWEACCGFQVSYCSTLTLVSSQISASTDFSICRGFCSFIYFIYYIYIQPFSPKGPKALWNRSPMDTECPL